MTTAILFNAAMKYVEECCTERGPFGMFEWNPAGHLRLIASATEWACQDEAVREKVLAENRSDSALLAAKAAVCDAYLAQKTAFDTESPTKFAAYCELTNAAIAALRELEKP